MGAGGGGKSTLWPGCNYTFLCGDIGKSIEQELFAEQMSQNRHVARYFRASAKEKGKAESEAEILNQNTDNGGAITLKELSIKTKIARDLMHSRTRSRTINEIQKVMTNDEEAKAKGWLGKFTPELRYEIGAYCLDIALQSLTSFSDNDSGLFGSRPFVHQIIRNPSDYSKKLGIVRMDRKLFDRFSEPTGELIEHLGVQPWTLPMISPPNPWKSLTQGGYYSFQTDCVRYREDPSHWALLFQADQVGELNRLYDALNYLGTTPWTINERILKVALALWNNGNDVCNLNSASPVPSFEEYLYGDNVASFRRREDFSSHEEYCTYISRVVSQKKAMSNAHSMKCDTNYKLELARAYCGLTFYFPHNVDFRGRAYPIPPHLNHLGSDLSRGLLLFAEGKELGGEIGLNWLKIQLANMKGKDKLPLGERISFVDGVLDKVQAVALDPLGPERDFWQRADEPWQSLAACFEITEALRDPINFKSRLPVQQDGSCNGSQHYAALGGDTWGASQVNLLPSDRPQDIYATVARLVQEDLNKLAETDSFAAKVREMVAVTRKIVKTPVMTNVYGVTNYGAKKQIDVNIKEIYGNEFLGNELGKACTLLASLVFKALDGLFVQARRIQDWLAKAAEEIGKAKPAEDDGLGEKFGSLVTWTSPIGFPVIQPYHKQNNVHLRTAVQTITLTCPDSERIDSAKQAAGFPPNFIHSLDASHMFMTAERCKLKGITFASVHDCFWTHAATVPIMNEQLRLAFIELHSQPILENLRSELIERYRGYIVKKERGPRPIYFPPIPVKGPLDISRVKESLYFFS
jgi:DNA-directed RNA polymerase, mitochondrial